MCAAVLCELLVYCCVQCSGSHVRVFVCVVFIVYCCVLCSREGCCVRGCVSIVTFELCDGAGVQGSGFVLTVFVCVAFYIVLLCALFP